MKVSSIRWGVIWIGIGLFFLFINLELLDSFAFPRLFSLWPILLIAIGVELIFRRTRLYFLALLSPLLIAGAFIWAASSTGQWRWQADEFWRGRAWHKLNSRVDIAEIAPDSSIRELSLDLQCGQARIRLIPSSNVLFKATSEYYRRSPIVRHSVDNGLAKIEFTDRDRGPSVLSKLNLSFAQDHLQVADFLPLSAVVSTSDNYPDLDFSHLQLSALELKLDSRDVSLNLGHEPRDIRISVSGQADKINLLIPENSSVLIRSHRSALADILRRAGMTEDSAGFYSDGRSGSARLDINLQADLEQLKIERQ